MVYPLDEAQSLAASPSNVKSLASMLSPASVVGQRKALALLVDFSDNPGKPPPATTTTFCLMTRNPTPCGPLQGHFIWTTRRGRSHFRCWIRAPKPYSYYTNGSSGMSPNGPNTRDLVKDILDIYCSKNSLAPFDLDGDGFMDGLFLVFAGAGAESEEDTSKRPHKIWSHKWVLRSSYKKNGVTAYAYFTAPEDGRLGVFSHEFGHFLGLPDLYDTSYRSSGIGNWCLMSGGSWNGAGNKPARMSAWCMQQLGWVKPQIVKSTQTLSLPPISNDPKCLLPPLDRRQIWTGVLPH
jgi:immune inhibitor A